jgi:hypothetical protein
MRDVEIAHFSDVWELLSRTHMHIQGVQRGFVKSEVFGFFTLCWSRVGKHFLSALLVVSNYFYFNFAAAG